jgi:diguanylate cyclase
LQDGEAAAFISHEVVVSRLHKSMQGWLTELFRVQTPDRVAAAVAHQRYVGEVHARIHLPIHLVARSARLYRRWINELLVASKLSREELLLASGYVSDVMDLALELMSSAFVVNSERSARAEEAYRLFALGQNISLERERQRAALLEWAQQVLFDLHRRADGALPTLGQSEFGLWLHHKAQVMFDGSHEVGQITESIERIDGVLLPQLTSAEEMAGEAGLALAQRLQSEINSIKFQLSAMFDRYVEIENGRDALTRLLNRRFLMPILNREIALQRRDAGGFAVLLIDIDHFKRVNDQHGHQAGDQVLQHAASLITNSVRAGDFVFRYGGEEVLVVLVEVDPVEAMQVAEKIRLAFEASTCLISEGGKLNVTVSIGVASFAGHPDYQYLIEQADQALYRAKNEGRNCCRAAA